MIPNVDERVISKEFSISEFTLNRPEAPWIKRWEYGIKFTNEIQFDDFTLTWKTPSMQQSPKPKHDDSTEKENKKGTFNC